MGRCIQKMRIDDMQTIDWNTMSELGLIERINTEILHPLGLALSRNTETGFSEQVLISDDGEWEYPPGMETTIISDDEVRERIEVLIEDRRYVKA